MDLIFLQRCLYVLYRSVSREIEVDKWMLKSQTKLSILKAFKWKFENLKIILTIPLSIWWNSFWEVVCFDCDFLAPNFCRNFEEFEVLPPPLGRIEFWPRKAATDERRLRLGAFNPVIEPGKSSPKPNVGHFVLSYIYKNSKERNNGG